MPTRLTWRNLIPGLIALAAIVLVVGAVLMFSGVGKVRGETVRVFVLADQARGLMAGSEVWLDGQKVGVVEDIGFRPADSDTLHRVVIALDVLRDAVAVLRDDSPVRVRSGGNVIGPVVVFLESGTPNGRPVRAGDTLRALAQSDVSAAMASLGAATTQLPALMSDARAVAGHARSPEGTLGAFLARGLPSREIAALRRNVGALLPERERSAPDRRGALVARMKLALARADSVRALLASPAGNVGRFRRDSTLTRAIADLTGELAALEREAADARGTLWRAQNDSALTRALTGARQEMTLLFADLKRRPLRYIHF